VSISLLGLSVLTSGVMRSGGMGRIRSFPGAPEWFFCRVFLIDQSHRISNVELKFEVLVTKTSRNRPPVGP